MAAKILLVDDEPAQLELLRYNLEKAGFETLQAENGQDAILLAEEHEPDLVVLDWMMPEASGIDVCRELRSRAQTRLLPIIMVSARGEEGDRGAAAAERPGASRRRGGGGRDCGRAGAATSGMPLEASLPD